MIHGSAYDFLRNTLLDANNWFNNLNGVPIPADHRNNFGFTVGGPIMKNKMFFFGDYDGNIQSNAGTNQAGVPTLPERGGDFGEVCTANGGSFNAAGMCSRGAGGRYGTRIQARTVRTFRARCVQTLFHSTMSPSMRAREIPSWSERRTS